MEAKVALMMGYATEQGGVGVHDLVGYNYFPYTYDSGHPGWKSPQTIPTGLWQRTRLPISVLTRPRATTSALR